MDTLPTAFAPLHEYKQFIIYRLIPDPKRPHKNIKKPIDYFSGHVANPLDPEIWTDFKTASDTSRALGNGYGVGFVLTANDPFFLIDIDGGINSETADILLNKFVTAGVEISSSGEGLHIIGSGTCPPHRSKPAAENKPTDCDIELYTQDRFVALTGHMTTGHVTADCTENLAWLVDKYFKPNESITPAAWTTEPRVDYYSTSTDDEIIQRALASTSARKVFGKGASFWELWNNDTVALARAFNSDDSAADAALAQHLAFWTGCNCERIHALMLCSALVRDKWHRPDRIYGTYLRRTILNAVGQQREVLQDRKPEPLARAAEPGAVAAPTLTTGNTFLSAEQQQRLFQGCVYIRDSHSVLIPGGNIVKSEQFKVIYGGYSFKLDNQNAKVTTDAWKAFTESQIIRPVHVDDVYFSPTQTPGKIFTVEGKRYVNTWFPVPIVRAAGDVTLFLKHIETILPNPRDQLILLSYLAAIVQYQGIKFKWCVLLQGVQGNGKSLFSDILMYCIGRRYIHFPKASELSQKFNDFLYGKIFIGVEEVFIHESHIEVLEIIKVMIDKEYQEVHKKFLMPIMREICCNFLLNSNHKDALRLVKGDRRFAPLFTAQQSLEDLHTAGMIDASGHPTAYFTQLFNWLREGGFATVADFLFTFKIPDEFNPTISCHRAPVTSSTIAAIKESQDFAVQEIQEAVESGEIGFRGGWISSIFLEQLLTRIRATRKYPRSKRRELLQALGYDWHPHLPNGRTKGVIMPDGGKPSLYIHNSNSAANITTNIEICVEYTRAQTL